MGGERPAAKYLYFTVLVVIGLILLSVVLLVAYTAHQASQTVIEPEIEMTHPWETHIDTSLGFSIKHPSELIVSTDRAVGIGYSFRSPALEFDTENAQVSAGWYMRVSALTSEYDSRAENTINDWFVKYTEEAGIKVLSEPIYIEVADRSAVVFEADMTRIGRTQRTAIAVDRDRLLLFDCFFAEQDRLTALRACERMLDTLQFLP